MPTTFDGRHTCADGCRYFNFMIWSWCVTYAQTLIEASPATAAELTEYADITTADSFLGLGERREDTVTLVGYKRLNREYAATVDLTKPIIVAGIVSDKGSEEDKTVIDGWHRIYRARTENLDCLPAYILSVEASIACRVDTFVR